MAGMIWRRGTYGHVNDLVAHPCTAFKRCHAWLDGIINLAVQACVSVTTKANYGVVLTREGLALFDWSMQCRGFIFDVMIIKGQHALLLFTMGNIRFIKAWWKLNIHVVLWTEENGRGLTPLTSSFGIKHPRVNGLCNSPLLGSVYAAIQ